MWPENAATVAAFLAAGSQWRAVAIAAGDTSRPFYLGLDYAGVKAALEALDIAITKALWCGIQIMEEAARDQSSHG